MSLIHGGCVEPMRRVLESLVLSFLQQPAASPKHAGTTKPGGCFWTLGVMRPRIWGPWSVLGALVLEAPWYVVLAHGSGPQTRTPTPCVTKPQAQQRKSLVRHSQLECRPPTLLQIHMEPEKEALKEEYRL